MSLLSVTGVPVLVCEYRVGSVIFKERQVGFFCDDQPKKVPQQKLELAMHNACSAKER